MQTSTVNASIKIGNSAGCALETKDKPKGVKRKPIIDQETKKSTIMSRFIVVATAILVLMAVSAYSNPTSSSEESNPPKCSVNEIYSLCGRMCEPKCDNPKPNPILCPAIECTTFTASCRCQKDYVRNKSGDCVLLKQC
ncbi:Probable protease inhibitor Egf0.4b [Anthophora quadrimaculata]